MQAQSPPLLTLPLAPDPDTNAPVANVPFVAAGVVTEQIWFTICQLFATHLPGGHTELPTISTVAILAYMLPSVPTVLPSTLDRR